MKGKLIFKNVAENRSEWLEKRKNTIGSSEIVTVCGLNPYRTPLELWAEKTGKIEPQKENEAMRLGSFMEKFIGERFARETGLTTQSANALYQHESLDWATASPDFFIVEQEEVKGVVECKNVNFRSLSQWEDNNIPDYAHMQTIWQLGVLGLQTGFVAALVGASANDFFSPEVEFSKSLFSQMVELGSRFLDYVKKDIPPNAGAGDKEVLNNLLEEKNKTIILPDENLLLINKYNTLKDKLADIREEAKPYEKALKETELQLMQIMDGANKGVCGHHLVELKKIRRKSYTVNETSYWSLKIKDEAKLNSKFPIGAY